MLNSALCPKNKTRITNHKSYRLRGIEFLSFKSNFNEAAEKKTIPSASHALTSAHNARK